LGVSVITDKADLTQKYHLLEESYGKKRIKVHADSFGKEQDQADRLGIYLVAAAGYRPEAHAEFWDRMAEVKGDTGSWFSDFFGTTKPESKRLRDLLRGAQGIPAHCVTHAAPAVADFKKWQAMVVENAAVAAAESLPGLAAQFVLNPELHSK